MNRDSNIGHITPAGGNVFLDLGFEPTEAARFKAQSNAVIIGKRVVVAARILQLPDALASATLGLTADAWQALKAGKACLMPSTESLAAASDLVEVVVWLDSLLGRDFASRWLLARNQSFLATPMKVLQAPGGLKRIVDYLRHQAAH